MFKNILDSPQSSLLGVGFFVTCIVVAAMFTNNQDFASDVLKTMGGMVGGFLLNHSEKPTT